MEGHGEGMLSFEPATRQRGLFAAFDWRAMTKFEAGCSL